LFVEVFTGFIILLSLFGFMDFVCITKWLTQRDIDYPSGVYTDKDTSI
jgi:hypothetical protein